jgi:hypothetical protein
MTSATTRSVAGFGQRLCRNLAADENLGRVDPDEANALPTAKPDRLAVSDMIDAVDG